MPSTRTIRISARNVNPENIAAVLADNVGATFAALTYSPRTGYVVPPVVRYSVTLGIDYHKRTAGYADALARIVGTFAGREAEEATRMLASFRETLAAAVEGRDHANNTRAGHYVPVAAGVRYLPDAGTFEVLGYVRARRVLVEGVRKVVNSRPETLLKAEARRNVERAIGYVAPSSFSLRADTLREVSYRGGVLSFR